MPTDVKTRENNEISEKEQLGLVEDNRNLCTKETNSSNIANADDERIAKIAFQCSACQLYEMVHYFGTQPTFVYGVEFCEPTYIMRDPFQPPVSSWKSKSEYFIALGAHCKVCKAVVCKDNDCSFYYEGTFCLSCARKSEAGFPIDVRQKLKKSAVPCK